MRSHAPVPYSPTPSHYRAYARVRAYESRNTVGDGGDATTQATKPPPPTLTTLEGRDLGEASQAVERPTGGLGVLATVKVAG